MSRLIVLSNRVKIPDDKPMAGGLAIALQDVLNGKSVVWMGWKPLPCQGRSTKNP